jgi:hypothetical protein
MANLYLLASSSCIAGTAGTLVTAPVDMIKTRLMLQRESKGARVYRNGFHCAYQVLILIFHFDVCGIRNCSW